MAAERTALDITTLARENEDRTVYAPPEHPPGTVHRTEAEADAAEHH